MVGKVGLLTREAMIAGHLPEAGRRYRHRGEWPDTWTSPSSSVPTTATRRCRSSSSAFETVGGAGGPGGLGKRHQFHDVALGDAVRVAGRRWRSTSRG